VIFSPFLIPSLALADPEMKPLPHITAGTGMDAFAQRRSLPAKGYHPVCDAVALQGRSWPG
jgi:alcohol dehydrogenase class IV